MSVTLNAINCAMMCHATNNPQIFGPPNARLTTIKSFMVIDIGGNLMSRVCAFMICNMVLFETK